MSSRGAPSRRDTPLSACAHTVRVEDRVLVLPQTLIESPALSPLLDKVMAVGGHWERIYGGILLLHLPPAEHQSIADEFNGLFNRLSGSTPDR